MFGKHMLMEYRYAPLPLPHVSGAYAWKTFHLGCDQILYISKIKELMIFSWSSYHCHSPP